MNLREKILAIFSRKGKTIREISSETNIPKSTVQYHKQMAIKRIENTGTLFWETGQGNEFLLRLMIAAIYVFCIKAGTGAGRLKEFLKLLELKSYLTTSESCILKIIKRIEALILEYKKVTEDEIYSKAEEISLILGVDETWFNKMYLVCQELSSGYLFVEAESEQRDAITWDKKINKIFKSLPQAVIKYFVSDREKALINLATVIYEVPSVADCFHFKHCINKLLCISLASKLRWSSIKLTEAYKTRKSELINEFSEKYAHIQFHTDLYAESMSNISQILHPFTQGNQTNTVELAQRDIYDELSNIEQVIDSCKINDKYKLFTKAEKQVPDVVSVIGLWHQLKEETLSEMKVPEQTKQWFKDYLLPKTYWELAIEKTKYKASKERLKGELKKCCEINQDKEIPTEMANIESNSLKQDAINLCRKFQRASSQVEGRNGHLALINHNQRSFDKNRLKVLTAVHNFDTRGTDGKTPAERLFGKKVKFKSIFEYILENYNDLPRPRNRKPTN